MLCFLSYACVANDNQAIQGMSEKRNLGISKEIYRVYKKTEPFKFQLFYRISFGQVLNSFYLIARECYNCCSFHDRRLVAT